MHIIPLEQISVLKNRQRQKFDEQKLKDLCQSILDVGLLNPPTFYKNEAGINVLVAGERRLRAIQKLAVEGKSFVCNQQVIHPGQLPILYFDQSDKLSRTQAELEENLMREDLTWAEKTAALAAFHALRTEANPGITQTAIATELAQKRSPTPITENQVTSQRNELRRAVIIAEHLHKPEIANARNANDAYQLVIKAESEAYHAELIRRKKKLVQSSLKCEIRHGDGVELMTQLDDNVVDLILTDPPYGIKANSAGYRSRTKIHHNYDDSEANARRILEALLVEGWRICKPQANLFIFTDIKHFSWLYENASHMGWTPWRYPVIWAKSMSEGLAPWGRNGFVHTYDIAFWATKGRRGTNNTHIDIIQASRVARSERVHAAEKPQLLLETLVNLMTQPGDMILDPCAGSGATLVAAKSLKRNSLGFEIDKETADMATVRINEGDDYADFSSINSRLSDNEGDTENVPDSDTTPVSLSEGEFEGSSLSGKMVEL